MKGRINNARYMPSTAVFLYKIYAFDNGTHVISMTRPLSLISCFDKKGDLYLYEARKEGKVFFRLWLKNGTYEDFMFHKEIYYIIRYTYS